MEGNARAVAHGGNIVAHVVGNPVQCAGLIDIIFGIGALPIEAVMTMAEIQAAVVAVMTIVQANGVMAALAVIALAASDMRLTRDAVADLEILNALAECNNLTGPFVTHDKRVIGGPVGERIAAMDHLGIRATDRDRLNPAKDLARAGLRNRNACKLEVVIGSQGHCFHHFGDTHRKNTPLEICAAPAAVEAWNRRIRMNAVTDDVEPILTQYSTQVNNNHKIILCNLVN